MNYDAAIANLLAHRPLLPKEKVVMLAAAQFNAK
jgi:hypothetical protein